ncbi:hypothetical protein BCU64_025740 [Vibrio lentus]
MNVSGLKDGTIAVTVNGTNDLEAPAKEAGTTFTLTQTKPTVDDSQTSINLTHAAAGESVTITATFDKGVTTPTRFDAGYSGEQPDSTHGYSNPMGGYSRSRVGWGFGEEGGVNAARL